MISYGDPTYDADVSVIISTKLEFNNMYNPYLLFPYQEFVRRFMSPYMKPRNLLLFHSLGSGKTSTCLSVIIDHYLHNGRKALIICKNIYGKHIFRAEFSRYCLNHPDGKNLRMSDICTTVSYVELSNRLSEVRDIEISRKYSNMIIVMDEIHNIKYEDVVYNKVYMQLRRLILCCSNIQVILSTATPMIDNVHQFKSITELVGNLHVSYNNIVENVSDHMYHGEKAYKYLHPILFIPMTGNQLKYYIAYSNISTHDVYRSDSQISLFCSMEGYYGPHIIHNMMTKVRIKDNIITNNGMKSITYSKYVILDKYRKEITTLLPETSCKYYYLIQHLENPANRGTFFVYIDEVMGSGIMLLSEILSHYGYELYLGDAIDNISQKKRFTYCVGDVELCPNIEDRISGFCNFDNSDGDYVKVLLGSRIIGEAITLRNVRHMHCVTPHWNENVINQVIGRVLRSYSHIGLREEDRFVNIYIYCVENSIDSHKLHLSNNKQREIIQKIDELRGDSIERYKNDDANDIATFIKYYFRIYRPILFDILNNFFLITSNEMYTINTIFGHMYNIDDRIVKQLLIDTVVNNRVVYSQKYVRFYLDNIILVDNPKIPYILTEIINHDLIPPNISRIPIMATDLDEMMVGDIKQLSIHQIKQILENAISTNNHDTLEMFRFCCFTYNDIIIHTLSYSENLNNAYKAAIPFPKTSTGYLRGYVNGQWSTISTDDEQRIIDMLKRDFIDLFESISEQPIYGILSVIDKRMRISLGMTELMEDSEKVDRRDKHRGRVTTTLLKSHLVIIASILKTDYILNDIAKYQRRFTSLEHIDTYYDMAEIKENYIHDTNIKLSRIIEDELVNRGMYIII